MNNEKKYNCANIKKKFYSNNNQYTNVVKNLAHVYILLSILFISCFYCKYIKG